MTSYRQTFSDGLWRNNPGLSQFLGICPLLAVSTTIVNGLGLGLATMFVLCATNLLISSTRGLLFAEVRLPVFVLVIASLVTVIELMFQAWFYELYLSLGIFIPLIVTNCIILGRAEAFASRQPVLPSLVDGIANGAGFALVLIALGGLREIIGRGTLFSGAEMLFGNAASGAEISIFPGQGGLLLVLLPPGAFFGLALLVALKNHVDALRSARDEPIGASAVSEAAG